MKLYYAPWACSLADHIALAEGGFEFDIARVDLKTCRLEDGSDFRTVSAKGYVPALMLDDGTMLTENVAVLDWIADQTPSLQVEGRLGRTRVLEALTFITTEIHRAFKPMWHGGGAEEKARAAATAARHLRFVAENLKGDYLFGDRPSVADLYLFVMLLWAERFGVETPPVLVALRERIRARPATQAAMLDEGMI